MVVDKYDGSGRMIERLLDDLAGTYDALGETAFIHNLVPDDGVPAGKQHDPEDLAAEILQMMPDQLVDIVAALNPVIATAIGHCQALADLDGCLDLRRLGITNAVDLTEFCERPAVEAPETTSMSLMRTGPTVLLSANVTVTPCLPCV